MYVGNNYVVICGNFTMSLFIMAVTMFLIRHLHVLHTCRFEKSFIHKLYSSIVISNHNST